MRPTSSQPNVNFGGQAHFLTRASGYLQTIGALSWVTIATTVFLLLLIAWATHSRVQHERAKEIAEWSANNTNLVNADEARIRRTIATLDKVLLVIRQDIEDIYKKRGFSRQQLADRVNQLSVPDDLSPKMALIDAQGILRLTTAEPAGTTPPKTDTKTQGISVADRDYFQHQLTNTNDELWIGVPIQSRVSGLWVLPFTRSITNPDGSFGGVLTMSVNPEVFNLPYSKSEMGESGSLAIIGLDGFTRIRKNGKTISYGDDARRSQVFKEIPKSLAGTYTARAAVDGVLRTVSYRVIAPYSLVVVTARSVDEILESMAGRVRLLWALGALLGTLLMLLATVIVINQVRQRSTIATLTTAESLRVALLTSEQSFKQLLELIPQLVITIDQAGDIQWVNQQAMDYIGAAAHASPSDLNWTRAALHPDDRDRVIELLNASLRDTLASPQCEHRLRRHDGEYHWFASQITPIFDSTGALTQWLGTCTDIHDHKLSTERLMQTQKLEAIGQLTGGMAHDFNNLLAIVVVNLDMIVATASDEKNTRRAQVALRAAERGTTLVKSLLALASRQVLAPQKVELCPVLEAMAPLIQQALGAQNRLVLAYDAAPLAVLVDVSGRVWNQPCSI
jgi:PAS domain S-box-containing protein